MNVCVYKSFCDIPPEVRRRLSFPNEPNFFLSLDWFALLFETSLIRSLVPRIYVLFDANGGVRGALFCGVMHKGIVRRLLSLTNFYTLEYGPSLNVNAVERRMAMNALMAYIAAERPRWHGVRFGIMKAADEEIQYLSDDVRQSGFSAFTFFPHDNWYAPVDGATFQSYFSQRDSQLRNTIIRKQKKLQTRGVAIEIFRSEHDDLERAVRDFVAVYNRSWKRPEPFPGFIPKLVTDCATLGILRLGILYVEGKPAAGQLWISTKSKATIYKLAYDEEYRDLSVGSVLSKEMFRVAIDEDGVDEIDYGVGSEPYKKSWMTSLRTIRGIEGFNRRTVVGLSMALREELSRALAPTVRRALSSWRSAVSYDPQEI